MLGGLIGVLVGAACTVGEARAICVKAFRACDEPSAQSCDETDECVPAEAYEADATTECEDGQCVWDCSAGEACPTGWQCQTQSQSLSELLGVGC